MLVRTYADRENISYSCSRSSSRGIVATIVLWLLAVVERGRVGHAFHANGWDLLRTCIFALTTFIVLGLTHVFMHVTSALLELIDTYCWDVARNRDASDAVRNWNVLQAILRKASATLEHCFFVLQATMFAVVLFGGVDMLMGISSEQMYIPDLLPAVLVCIGILRVFRASTVTSRCTHVPSLLNSLSFGADIDMERQYVVEYIINSAAGFHVYDVRLTCSLAFKLMYMLAAVAFGFATSVLPKS